VRMPSVVDFLRLFRVYRDLEERLQSCAQRELRLHEFMDSLAKDRDRFRDERDDLDSKLQAEQERSYYLAIERDELRLAYTHDTNKLKDQVQEWQKEATQWREACERTDRLRDEAVNRSISVLETFNTRLLSAITPEAAPTFDKLNPTVRKLTPHQVTRTQEADFLKAEIDKRKAAKQS